MSFSVNIVAEILFTPTGFVIYQPLERNLHTFYVFFFQQVFPTVFQFESLYISGKLTQFVFDGMFKKS